MRIGYARVSTPEQSLDLQLDALSQAGCERIFSNQASGAKTQRPGLAATLSHLRAGDVLVIWKRDRRGRSVKGLVDLVRDVTLTKGVTRERILNFSPCETRSGLHPRVARDHGPWRLLARLPRRNRILYYVLWIIT